MRYSKTAFLLAIAMLLCFAVTGCGGSPSAPAGQSESDLSVSEPAYGTPSETPPASAPEEKGKTDHMITDDLGREIIIPENTERIVALTSSVMQALINIGIEPMGKVEEYKVTEAGAALPSIGSTSDINIEAVYALEPELIIANSRSHAALEEELKQSGAIIYYFDPNAVGETPLIEVTAHLGTLLGKEAEAAEYIQSVYELSGELKVKVASETGIKTGIIIQAGDTIQAAQTTSGYGSMLSLLGIENIVPADLPGAKKSPFVAFDIETILESDPDLVLIVAPGKDADENKAVLEKFKNDPQWQGLDATRNGRMMILPFSVNANRSSPEDMLKTTAQTILKAAN